MAKINWQKIIKKRILIIVGGLGLVVSLLFNLFQHQRLQKIEEKNFVVEVTDGDTFVLKTSIRVRLRDVDAPPLEFCGGKQAKKKLEELVLNKKVSFEDETVGEFKRILAFVFVGNKSVGEELLKDGWARFDGHVSSSQGKDFRAAYQQAMEEKKGIFSPLCRQKENLDNPDCVIKGNIYQKTGVKTYHFPGCSEYEGTIIEKDRGEQWFCTEAEARKAGYKKATHCYGKRFR